MFTSIQKPSSSTAVLFYCFIGNIIEDKLLLFRPTVKEISLDDIRSVAFEKRRDLLLNYLSGLFVVFSTIWLIYNEFDLVLLGVSLVFLALAVLIKKQFACIKLILKSSSVIYIKLSKKEEKKGQIFVKQIKKIIH